MHHSISLASHDDAASILPETSSQGCGCVNEATPYRRTSAEKVARYSVMLCAIQRFKGSVYQHLKRRMNNYGLEAKCLVEEVADTLKAAVA